MPMSTLWKSGVITLQACCMIHCVREYVAEVHACSGPSMLPTFNVSGDILLLSRMHARGKRCSVGDIIAATHPNDKKGWISKRVIGLPGDVVCVDPTRHPKTYVKVPQGHAWVVGDNLPHSSDSRTWGPLPMALIKGKVVARVYPHAQWI